MPASPRDSLRARLHAEAKRMMIDGSVPAAIRRPMRWMMVSILGIMGGVVFLAALTRVGGSRGLLISAIVGLLGLGVCCALLANHAVTRALRRAKSACYCLCPGCAYDLRALDAKGTCPECGRANEHDTVRAAWLDAERRLKRK